jgi:riboflavin kinase / FMN adenylyltransferase
MKMISRVTDINQLPNDLKGGVVAIGNFDGVHRGHRAVLNHALEIAHTLNKPSLVLTFEPHPRAIFQPENPVFRLTPPHVKAQLLQELGFNCVVEQAFSYDFAKLTADEFVKTMLLDGLNAAHVVTGFDFHFGKGRQAGPAFLMSTGKKHDFDVTLIDAFRDEETTVISSSRIRELLSIGDVANAANLLGYHYSVSGLVIKGKQLGRTLGFPTANIALEPNHSLKFGIYAVRFRLENGDIYNGVASFGSRPSVEKNGRPLLETFIFDFNKDIYNQDCIVSFISFIRNEEKFDSLEALTIQMHKDANKARKSLDANPNKSRA